MTAPDHIVLRLLRETRANQRADPCVFTELRQDIRMLPAAINDFARTNVTAGEIDTVHTDIDRLHDKTANIDARVRALEPEDGSGSETDRTAGSGGGSSAAPPCPAPHGLGNVLRRPIVSFGAISKIPPARSAGWRKGGTTMRGSQWKPMGDMSRFVTGILVIAALGFAAFVYRYDPDILKRSDGIDQSKVDPRPAISATINRLLGTEAAPDNGSH